MSHPHSSWHLHYQILRNNWEQKTGLPIVSLQRIRIHLPRPEYERGETLKLLAILQTMNKITRWKERERE